MSAVKGLLAGKVGLVTGIANERSIAAGCARAFRDAGAQLVLTYREKSMPFVMPVAKRARAPVRQLVTIEDVGAIAMGLVSDLARNVTGTTAYVDAGYHVMA